MPQRRRMPSPIQKAFAALKRSGTWTEHGGLHEIPIFKSPGMTFPADDELGTFLDPGLDVLLHARVLLCAGQRAEGDVLVPRIARFDFFDGRLGQSLHFVEAVFRHDQMQGRNAGLSVIQVAGVERVDPFAWQRRRATAVAVPFGIPCYFAKRS